MFQYVIPRCEHLRTSKDDALRAFKELKDRLVTPA